MGQNKVVQRTTEHRQHSMQCQVFRLRLVTIRTVAPPFETQNLQWPNDSLEKLLRALKKFSHGLQDDPQFQLRLQIQIFTIKHFLKTQQILQDLSSRIWCLKLPDLLSRWILSVQQSFAVPRNRRGNHWQQKCLE